MRLGMCHVVVLISVVRHRTLVGLRTVLAVGDMTTYSLRCQRPTIYF